MQTKICSKCHIEKSINEFYKINNKTDRYRSSCKCCYNEYYQQHKEHKKEYNKNYNKNNKEKISQQKKEYYQKNKERIIKKQSLYGKEYYQKNIHSIKKRHNDYNKKHKKEINEFRRNYHRQRSNIDNMFKFKHNIKILIGKSFRRKAYTKNSHTYEILGAEYEFVWEHLLNTWYNNYGTKYNGEDYHIDHIIPIDVAKTEEEVIKLCHYTNLQLLKPKDNMKKSNKLNWKLK